MDNITSTDPSCYPVPEGYAELHKAYRSAVGAALHLQRALQLPPEQCAVLTRAERQELVRQVDKPNINE